MPQILSLAIKRAGEWQTQQWKWLYRIRHSVISKYKDKQRKSTRTMRIDQRVAIQAILKTLLSHLDLSSMCVGYYHKETGAFIHLSLEYLARKAGLNHRRAQRAIHWLYQSGYITQFKQSFYDDETDEYVHRPAVRRINPILLLDLGITQLALATARKRSKTKIAKYKMSIMPIVPIKEVKRVKEKITQATKVVSLFKPIPTDTSKYHIDYESKLQKLMRALPHLTLDEAKSMLPNPQ